MRKAEGAALSSVFFAAPGNSAVDVPVAPAAAQQLHAVKSQREKVAIGLLDRGRDDAVGEGGRVGVLAQGHGRTRVCRMHARGRGSPGKDPTEQIMIPFCRAHEFQFTLLHTESKGTGLAKPESLRGLPNRASGACSFAICAE